MCHKNIKIISSIKEGSLIKCQCGSYTFKFNNIIFEFTEYELRSFKKYLMKINVDYWENQCICNISTCRKIPIITSQGNLLLIFNRLEFEKIKKIIFPNKKSNFDLLTHKDLQLSICEN